MVGNGYRYALPPGPQALALELLDDDPVLRGLPALRAEQAPVGVPHRVRALPATEPADAVGVARVQK